MHNSRKTKKQTKFKHLFNPPKLDWFSHLTSSQIYDNPRQMQTMFFACFIPCLSSNLLIKLAKPDTIVRVSVKNKSLLPAETNWINGLEDVSDNKEYAWYLIITFVVCRLHRDRHRAQHRKCRLHSWTFAIEPLQNGGWTVSRALTTVAITINNP